MECLCLLHPMCVQCVLIHFLLETKYLKYKGGKHTQSPSHLLSAPKYEALCSVVSLDLPVYTSQQPCSADSVVISMLQMKKRV